ncbi:MAG TPA: universal stress protein, partial [Syntrophomonas sp.]|nr:universal stress protein [Syntrophomonas sp.]
NNLKEAGQTIIDDTVKQLPPSKVEINTTTVWGTPERIIINEITARGYDLVVMGSRGLGTFSGLLLGSVSDRVLRQASCPVLIVK